ncbi:MAG TPA: hypothetical protein PKW23_07890 [Dictyoglomaceae bacterium]|nr:hypothetical protein [Dictyoglomaceae bacterium]HOL40098.1 hypothetical protein [Dictyoglomaceae bacterium]HPP16706.1 hypothetical protein [Dictyoglomaceae bacterium]
MKKKILIMVLVVLLTIVSVIFADPGEQGNQTTSVPPAAGVEVKNLSE